MTFTAFSEAQADLAELDRAEEIAPDLTLPPMAQLPAVISVESQFLPVPMALIREVATLLHGMPGLAPQFQDIKVCEAIAYRAGRWRADPVFVAEQTYFTGAGEKMRIGYQAQVVNAVILANAPFARRPRLIYGYGGDGATTAANRFAKAFLFFRGEEEPVSVTSPTVAQIRIKNSPLWISDPDQQLSYYVIRAAARRYCPDVLAGIYTAEEVQLMVDAEPRAPRGYSLFEEDEPAPAPIDAEFDSIPPTGDDLKRHGRWEQKAEGGDSRDPRDAPQERQARAARPSAEDKPPTGAVEPDDMADIRAWAATEQERIMALPLAQEHEAWNAFVMDKRARRFMAYDQGAAKALQRAVLADIDKKEAAAK